MVRVGCLLLILFLHHLMRKIFSILFLSLMLLQAIPVLHFFFSQKEVFYTYIDEEKPDGKSIEKKDGKEFLSLSLPSPLTQTIKKQFPFHVENQPASPLLECLTPPPDAI